jgi:hypothetical protein
MLAIAVQALVLTPHVHAFAPADHHAASISSHADNAPAALVACAVCQAAASARVFTATPEVTLAALTRVAAPAPDQADQSVTLTPAPPWRSRAPPLSLS